MEQEIARLPSSKKQELAKLRRASIAQDGKAARELRIFIREHFTEQVGLAVVGEDREIAIAQATEMIYQTVLGCTTDELYSREGTVRGRRDTLPASAQNAIMMGEARAAEGLEEAEFDGNFWERVDQVNFICRQNGQKVRRWLPW